MELAIVRSNQHPPPAPELDRKLWRQLPIELLERILSHIPLKTFISLRSTCKYFRSVIFSPVFLSKHLNSPSPPPLNSFMLLSHPQSSRYLLYDTVANTWREIDLRLASHLTFTPLLCTATSLLCFSAKPDSSNSAFVVHNLLARASRTVKFPEYPFAFESPTLIASSTGYHLFCMSSGASPQPHLHAYVYNSRIREWKRYLGFNRTLTDSYHQKGAYHNGSLYFTTREPFSVVGFGLETGNWETPEAEVPEELTFVRMAAGDGRLFMFGGIGGDGISRSMKVWELDGNGRRWREIGSVPQVMCKNLGSVCYHHYEHVYCFWHQGMICVCCYTWPEILYYKVARKTWHWTPKSPSLPQKWSCGFQWYSFVPQLYPFV